jgi:hypothetical protein
MNPSPAVMAILALAAAAAAAQDAVDLRRETRQGDLDAPLEEGVADVSALGTSMRLIDPGLVSPMDFGAVYRVPGMPAMLMRIAGGIYAVFPQSVYSEDGAMIPPGTTFYIGAPPEMMANGMALPSLLPPVLEPGDLGASAPPPTRSLIPAGDLGGGWRDEGASTIANNAVYRRERLHELMREAAANATTDEVE